MKIKSKVLIIAGSDSSGGAGIQADIKTVSSLGSYAMTAVTAVTVQNTTGVESIFNVSPTAISKQIEFSSKDIRPDTIKIGMLANKKVINAVLKSILKIKVNKIILDPVMVAKGGERLINKNAINILKEKLMKKATLITPNIPEAEILANHQINSKEDMIIAGKKLLKIGVKNVLIKGGHLKSKITYDILLEKNKTIIFKNRKIISNHTHGTGCTLSSAIATYYSCGKSLKRSCEIAIKYVNQAIKYAPKYGKGHGPINHLNAVKIKKKFR